MWYIFAIMLNALATSAALLGVLCLSAPVRGQSPGHPAARTQPAATGAGESTPDAARGPAEDDGPHAYAQPPIIVTNPAPEPRRWTLHDRIAWAALLVLAVVGYAGVMLGVSTLRKIERHTRAGEVAAQAALETASAALLHARALIESQRPWLLVTPEPELTVENSFKVTVTNRGRTPARIVALMKRIDLAPDESQLSAAPRYEDAESGVLPVPILLLPGESAVIWQFSRDDLKWACATDQTLRRVESWEDKVFLHGRVIYNALIAPPGAPAHETAWCCRYIHGSRKSGLVMGGPASYHNHT